MLRTLVVLVLLLLLPKTVFLDGIGEKIELSLHLKSLWKLGSIRFYTFADDSILSHLIDNRHCSETFISVVQLVESEEESLDHKVSGEVPEINVVVSAGEDNSASLSEYLNKVQFHEDLWLIPANLNTDGFTLRLDSQLFVYEVKFATIEVKEVYAIKNESRMSTNLGHWDIANQTYVAQTTKEIFDRRTDFQGVRLKNTMLPFSTFYFVDPINDTDRGAFTDIVQSMAESLNFTLETVAPADGQWGSLTNGSWSGMVGMLATREADISAAGLMSSPERLLVMDMTNAMYRDLITVTLPKTGGHKDIDLLAYANIFHWQAWCVVLAFMAVMCLAFLAIVWCKIDSIHCEEEQERFSILNSIGLVSLLLMQRDYPAEKKRLSTKFLFFTTCFFCYLVYSFYAALLTSTMIFSPHHNSILNFEDILADGKFKLIIFENTVIHQWFKDAAPGSPFNRLYDRFIKDNKESLYTTADEGIERLLSSPNAIAFDSSTTFADTDDVESIGDFEDSVATNFCLALVKDSEFTAAFRRYLLILEESGLLRKLFQKWNLEQDVEHEEEDQLGQDGIVSLAFENVFVPFVILVAGVVVGVGMYGLEKGVGNVCSL